jgi:hypothetical protein
MNTHKVTLFLHPLNIEIEGVLEDFRFHYDRPDGTKGTYIGTYMEGMSGILALVGTHGIVGQITPIGPNGPEAIH